MKRTLIVLAGLALAITAIGQPAQAAVTSHAVGSSWSETEADGSVATVTQIDAVAQKVTVTKPSAARVSLLKASGVAVPAAKTDCTWGYICFWNSPGFLMTMWRYNTAAINSGGGCYNMTSANNNVSESYYANQAYTGSIHNWVNCNSPAGALPNNGNPNQGVYISYANGSGDSACTNYVNFLPCDWATSISTDPV